MMAGRFEHLDGLRGMAAFIVILSHALLAFDAALLTGAPADSVTPWDRWLSGAPLQIETAGNLSVCLFFAMSGFVLIGAFDKADIGFIPLLLKRYVRLAIPVTCACLLACLLLSFGWMANHEVAKFTHSTLWLGVQYSQSPSLANALQAGLWDTFFRPFNLSTTYDNPLWTMPIEFIGSVGVLLICFAAKRLYPATNTRQIGYIAIFSFSYGIFAESYFGLFAAGALIRQVLSIGWGPLNRRPTLTFAIFLVGLFVGTLPVSQASWPIFHHFPDPGALAWMPRPVTGPNFWHTIGAIMMLASLQSSTFIQTLLKSRICRWLGSISFPLYLIHIPILMTLGCHVFLIGNEFGVSHKVSAIAATAAFILASLLGAQVFTLVIEKRAIHFSGYIAKRMQSAISSLVMAAQVVPFRR